MNLTDEVLSELEASAGAVHEDDWEEATADLRPESLREFVTSADPATVRALVAEVRRLRRELEASRSQHMSTIDHLERDQRALDECRDDLKKSEEMNDWLTKTNSAACEVAACAQPLFMALPPGPQRDASTAAWAKWMAARSER